MSPKRVLPSFPLRLRSAQLRELVREISSRERISQNELIEQAVAHEVLLRGATMVADLESAAERISELTDAEYARVVERSLTAFAEGEGMGEPLQARAVEMVSDEGSEPATHLLLDNDRLGVMAAFDAAQTFPSGTRLGPSATA